MLNATLFQRFLFGVSALLVSVGLVVREPLSDTDWTGYNGDGGRSHYSSLDQITPDNVQHLRVAWTYASGGADTVGNRSQMQCNPIVVGGMLYGVSANTQAFAVDAAMGRQRWQTHLLDTDGTTSRGVTYWTDGTEGRIFFGAGSGLYALNATSGEVINEFGQNGRIDLLEGITRPGADEYVRANTPNTIYKNLLIVGARVSEGETALLGDIRAYNVRTGRQVWTFHTIPQPGKPGYATWAPANPRGRLGGANAWAGMAIDLNTGEHRWQVPLGEYPELSAKGMGPTSTDNYGDPLVTGSGLLLIAASRDSQLRAIDKKGGKLGCKSVDRYVAFALAP